jgi:hypothetical protein
MNDINTTDKKTRDQAAAEVLGDLFATAKAILEINLQRLQAPTWPRIEEAKHTRLILQQAHDFLTR